MLEWIPYSRIRNVNEIAKGGFGTIYCADWIIDKHYNKVSVVLKRFENSQNFSRYFLSEVIIFNIYIF
jgi:serine/threonine protein kinase